jgi:hypothetical protein
MTFLKVRKSQKEIFVSSILQRFFPHISALRDKKG